MKPNLVRIDLYKCLLPPRDVPLRSCFICVSFKNGNRCKIEIKKERKAVLPNYHPDTFLVLEGRRVLGWCSIHKTSFLVIILLLFRGTTDTFTFSCTFLPRRSRPRRRHGLGSVHISIGILCGPRGGRSCHNTATGCVRVRSLEAPARTPRDVAYNLGDLVKNSRATANRSVLRTLRSSSDSAALAIMVERVLVIVPTVVMVVELGHVEKGASSGEGADGGHGQTGHSGSLPTGY